MIQKIAECSKQNGGCLGKIVDGVRPDGKISGYCKPCLKVNHQDNETRLRKAFIARGFGIKSVNVSSNYTEKGHTEDENNRVEAEYNRQVAAGEFVPNQRSEPKKKMTAALRAIFARCFPTAIRVGSGQRQQTRSPQPSGLPRPIKSRVPFLEAMQTYDEKCAACRNPFGVDMVLFMENRIAQNIPNHSHFGLTRAQGRRMNVSTEGHDYPMCLACQLILGNNKSDQWTSLEEFGAYSKQLQMTRGYKIRRRRDDGDCVVFEPLANAAAAGL